MANVDLKFQSMTRRAIYKASGGAQVTFTRVTGAAPAATTTTATVCALVRGYLPDSSESSREGYGASSLGAITLGERSVLVMVDDLANAGFPLPLAKGDVVLATDTGERLKISRVDPYKRAIAGAIEAFAVVA
jgi:hypothetical protein